MTETVLEEAARITGDGGARRQDYPSPLDEAERMAQIIRAITGLPFRAEHWPLVMVAMKLMRQSAQHKRDNLVDIAGYARMAEMLWDEREAHDD